MQTVVIGVDPGWVHNGVAIMQENDVKSYTIDGLDRIALCKTLGALAVHEPLVIAYIERPWTSEYKSKRSQQSRKESQAAADTWQKVLLKLFPTRHVHFIRPEKWQKEILGLTRKSRNTKILAKHFCDEHRWTYSNDHEADALCIAHYAKTQHFK